MWAWRTETVTVRLSPETKDQAMAFAKEDGRALSSWIERLVVAAIETRLDEEARRVLE